MSLTDSNWTILFPGRKRPDFKDSKPHTSLGYDGTE